MPSVCETVGCTSIQGVHMSTCVRDQQRTPGILPCGSLYYSFEAGSLAEPVARLAAGTLHDAPVSALLVLGSQVCMVMWVLGVQTQALVLLQASS